MVIIVLSIARRNLNDFGGGGLEAERLNDSSRLRDIICDGTSVIIG